MTFSDILDSSFLERSLDLSIVDIVLALVISFLVGLFILFIYKKTFTGVMYSSGFGISILAMSLVTTLVILAITSNIVLSLGMVGALSIVRFRTAVKEPLDIVFVFWSISVGIVVGAGLIPLAIIGSLIIGLILFFFVNKKSKDIPYVIILNLSDNETEEKAFDLIESSTKKHIVKSKSVSKGGIEVTVEVRLKNNSTAILNELLSIDGVDNAVLVSYNGEYYG